MRTKLTDTQNPAKVAETLENRRSLPVTAPLVATIAAGAAPVETNDQMSEQQLAIALDRMEDKADHVAQMDLFRSIRELSDREFQRVQVFVRCAASRQGNPEQEAKFDPIDEFCNVMQALHEGRTPAKIRKDYEYTPGQWHRLEKALELINSVYEDVWKEAYTTAIAG
ncbi:MAG: hypothetical protein V4671_09690 [Armatimonadota bacterium]